MKINKFTSWIYALCLLAVGFGCSDDESFSASSKQTIHSYKVAVCYAPQKVTQWKRLAEWSEAIMTQAQQMLDKAVRLELEWINEESADLETQLRRVTDDEQYVAIIGPADARKASMAAQYCMDSQKTLILPETANAEFQRIYASKNYVYCLTQNDVMQAEVMFSLLRNGDLMGDSQFNRVAFIASDDSYGDTFRQWFGYLATERYLSTDYVGILNDQLSVEEAIRRWIEGETSNDATAESYAPYLFFASSRADDLIKADAELSRLKEASGLPAFLYFYRVFSAGLFLTDEEIAQIKNTYEGVQVAPNPSSGFAPCYQAKFGEEPLEGEAQFFDAITLLYYALTAMEADGAAVFADSTDDLGLPARHSTLNGYLEKVVDGRESAPLGWLQGNAGLLFSLLQAGHYPDIEGVSSDLTFDSRFHCAVTRSIYRHWRIHNGRCVTLEYLSADGSDRTVSSIEEWSTQVEVIQQLKDEETHITYPPLTDHYAVVVAASSGWSNYRHQADALAMYRLLKQQGYDDDHILLIMEDDIAYHDYNSYPGVIKVTPDGNNLYGDDVKVDYKMSDLSAYDLKNILSGTSTSHTPKVLPTTAGDNVLLFWSGHGDYGLLNYGNYNVTAQQLLETIHEMKANQKFRKLFCVIEACYSGSVASYCEGTDGVLFMTAANGAETSKADMKDPQLNVYLSNGFTRAFQSKITENPSVTLHDLFYHVATQTVGSHACIYNQTHYGNLFTERMDEYMLIK